MAFIGKNGAGKSTLLKILSRIIEPTAGTALIRGRIASLLEVGTGFHPELTGRENIFLNGAILGMPKEKILRRFDEIVDFAEMEKFLDTPVKHYSSGMYTKLGFSIAAHLDPDILIVDEVLAVGDAAFQAKCLKKLDSFSKSGRTILFVSHNIQALTSLCDKAVLMAGGKVACSGSMQQCLNMYLEGSKRSVFSWDGDVGDGSLKVRKVLLEHESDFFYQNEISSITIECEVFRPLQEGAVSLEIKNSRQQTLLHSLVNKLTPGKLQLSLPIPMDLFWEGDYSLIVKYGCNEIPLKFSIYPPQNGSFPIDLSHMEGIRLPAKWKVSNLEVLCQR
jgi:lipopolysaccharide transport system ATP-binding protein